MEDLEKYQRVNKCETLKELANVIREFGGDVKMIQGRKKIFDSDKMAKACENLRVDLNTRSANILTREFGIRQQALYIAYYEGNWPVKEQILIKKIEIKEK